MTGPSRVELSVSGILNGKQFSARGTLRVDDTEGTKSGTITYQALPGGVLPGPDCTLVSTGKCFIGARQLGERRFVGPLDLLGREFISMRATTVGRSDSVSIGERALFVGGALRSELTAVGKTSVRGVLGVGPLRELITVSGPDTLMSEGRYSLRTARGGAIPVRYTHFYRSLHPDRRLFGRLRGRAFLLRATISTKVRGRTLVYRSRSTIARVNAR